LTPDLDLIKHFPFKGQLFLSLQLHSFLGLALFCSKCAGRTWVGAVGIDWLGGVDKVEFGI